MTVYAAYRALSPAAGSKSPAAPVLDAITNAPLTALNDSDRAGLVQLLIDDIVAARAGQSSRLTPKDVPQALGAIKSIGRLESGSRVIATEKNMRHFLAFAADLSNPDASKQAMRCIANAILLVPSGRDVLVDIEGDEFCTRLYINETSPEYLFLASRLLFFMAHTDGEYIERVVKQHRLPGLLALRLETLATAVQADAPLAKEALTDMLKLHFTVVSKYARHEGVASSGSVLGEYWDEVFEPTAAPLIRLLHTLPSTPASPLAPPLTHVIHALLNLPVAPYAHLLFPDPTTATATTPGQPQPQPSSSSPRTSRSSSSGATQSPRPSFSGERANASGSAVESSGSPLSRALNLLNRKTSPARSKPSSPSPISTSLPPTGDSAVRALQILQSTLALYLPGNSDPDDASVRNTAKAKNVIVDELASPIAALITRMAAADPGARTRIANTVFPADLDRSSPLEKKDDFLGRCLRLMTSVYYPTLKDAVGEMLFVICGSDGQALSAAIGYGNAAGFLYNKGIMAPPPASAGGDDINPITGARQTDEGPSLEDMTEEEKQREAERLFVLFDRMERMGMAKNPIREAYQSGKLQDP